MKFIELQNKINAMSSEIKGQGKLDFKLSLCQAINEIAKNEHLNIRANYQYGERDNLIEILALNEKGFSLQYFKYVRFSTSRELVKNKYYWGREHTAYYTLKEIEIYENEKDINEWVEECRETKENAIKKQNDEIAKLEKYIKENPEFVEMENLYSKHRYSLSDETRKLFW